MPTAVPLLAQPLVTTHLLSFSTDLPLLDTSQKWNHITCGLLCLASFSYYNVFKVCPCWSISASLLFMAEKYSVVWIYHVVSVRSSADGHLGCFHFGAIVTNAAMIIPVFT